MPRTTITRPELQKYLDGVVVPLARRRQGVCLLTAEGAIRLQLQYEIQAMVRLVPTP